MHPPFQESVRVLVTGITSIHGWPLFRALRSTIPVDRLFGVRPPTAAIPEGANVAAICMTDARELTRLRDHFKPTHVLHAAGVCDLDVCEARPAYAWSINVQGAENIVSVFSQSCYVMYLSADLVFSGNNPSNKGYSENDEPDPVSVVGKTFLRAEKEIAKAPRHAVIRIGLPMGESLQGTKGAVNFIEGRLKRGLPVSLFHDEYRSCIECDDLADAVLSLLSMEVKGLFHVGGPLPVSLFEIGERLLKRAAYRATSLQRRSRVDDVNGPPRIGNVHLNSAKAEQRLGRTIKPWV